MIQIGRSLAKVIKRHPKSQAAVVTKELHTLDTKVSDRFDGPLILNISSFDGGMSGPDFRFVYLAEIAKKKFFGLIPFSNQRLLALVDIMGYVHCLGAIIYDPAVKDEINEIVERLASKHGLKPAVVEQKEAVIFGFLAVPR